MRPVCKLIVLFIVVEVSYVIRFFERNDWHAGDPWSLRQTAMYGRFDLTSADSAWILIKPSPHLKELLEQKLKAIRLPNQRYIITHLVALSFTLRNWRDFIMYHTSRLVDIVRMQHPCCTPILSVSRTGREDNLLERGRKRNQ